MDSLFTASRIILGERDIDTGVPYVPYYGVVFPFASLDSDTETIPTNVVSYWTANSVLRVLSECFIAQSLPLSLDDVVLFWSLSGLDSGL